MNILPKKRWHVRTKENIARVRRDEAEAAEKEKQERLRIENATRESRLNILKHKSKEKLKESGIEVTELEEQYVSNEHLNLFADIEHTTRTTNKDHDKEVREKNEEYEKKIGYLTYLGQDTNEALQKKNWYEVTPGAARYTRSSEIKDTYEKLVLKDKDGKPKTKELDILNGEVAWKAKQRLDPINAFKKYLKSNKKHPKTESATCSNEPKVSEISTHTAKHKKKKSKKDEMKEKLQKLREIRLKREQQEKYRTEMFLTGLNKSVVSTEQHNVSKVKAKYNSQFNPELARQNYT